MGVPPRSPDLSTIKNFPALVTETLCKQAIRCNIVGETFNEFVLWVQKTMLSLSIAKIYRIIEYMDKRITLIMENKGCQTEVQALFCCRY